MNVIINITIVTIMITLLMGDIGKSCDSSIKIIQIVLNTSKAIISIVTESKKIKEIAKKCRLIMKKYGVVKAGIFGSYARGEEKKSSDVDMLIKGPKKFSLFDLVGLEMELGERIGKKVDLLTYNGISPFLKESILKEEVKIL